MNKEKTLAAIKDMPQEFDVDELIERILFIDKIEKGIQLATEGKTVSHEEVKRIAKTWSK